MFILWKTSSPSAKEVEMSEYVVPEALIDHFLTDVALLEPKLSTYISIEVLDGCKQTSFAVELFTNL